MAEIQIARRGGTDESAAAARADIEQTRARMSETIDDIERVLLRKKERVLSTKERVKERLDVLAPVRERPLASVGAAFAGALLLGWLSGGGDDGEPRRADYGGAGWQERSERWEGRTRRLLGIARVQSEEIRELREGLEELREEAHEERARKDKERLSARSSWRDRVTETLTDFIGDALRQLARQL